MTRCSFSFEKKSQFTRCTDITQGGVCQLMCNDKITSLCDKYISSQGCCCFSASPLSRRQALLHPTNYNTNCSLSVFGVARERQLHQVFLLSFHIVNRVLKWKQNQMLSQVIDVRKRHGKCIVQTTHWSRRDRHWQGFLNRWFGHLTRTSESLANPIAHRAGDGRRARTTGGRETGRRSGCVVMSSQCSNGPGLQEWPDRTRCSPDKDFTRAVHTAQLGSTRLPRLLVFRNVCEVLRKPSWYKKVQNCRPLT